MNTYTLSFIKLWTLIDFIKNQFLVSAFVMLVFAQFFFLYRKRKEHKSEYFKIRINPELS